MGSVRTMRECLYVSLWFFHWCLAEVGQTLPKRPFILGHHFPCPLSRLFLECILPVPVGSSRIDASGMLCLGYMGSNKNTRGLTAMLFLKS